MRALMLSTVILLFVLSLGNFFQSPRSGQYNPCLTESSLVGHEWLLDHKDDQTPVSEVLGLFSRYQDLILGPREARIRADFSFYGADVSLSRHFGYDEYPTLGSQYNSSGYIVFDDAAREYYTHVFPYQGSFTASDFAELTHDPTVDIIYDNGNLVCHVVTPVS